MTSTTTIRPSTGDRIRTSNPKRPHTICSVSGRGNSRKAYCGCTGYSLTNLRLVSKGGTRAYPVRTWKYVG